MRELPQIPDDDADFTPDLARKIIAKYQELLRGVAQAPTEAQIERGARAMCEWKHGVGSWDTFSSLRDHFVGQMRAGLSTLSSTHQRCAKCGCETKGEAALVDGKIWCHPCADMVPSTVLCTPSDGGGK